ncbi:MAG: DNA polymerase III subunit delta [Candidatus Buchananbacteria bacterium]|nr:DNA polymerase III subunit delta [Candidatus Buchananbacteria bacterium]
MIFTILGNDHYLVSRKLKELKDGFIQKRDKAGFNVVPLDGENLVLSQIQEEALTTPFLSERKMVVVKNSLANKKIGSEILEFIRNNKDRIDNIICFVDFIDPEKNKVDRKNKLIINSPLFKYLSEQEYFWQLNSIKGRELENWIKKYALEKSIKIDPLAVKELTVVAGHDLFQITSELNKLSAFKNGETIMPEDIKTIVSDKFSDNIFGLADALGSKDKNKALKLMANQINFGTHPLMIISMMARQFKLILKAKTAGTGPAKLNIQPFILNKVKTQGKNFTINQLVAIINEILEIERQIKSGETNPELLLNLFITKNC